MRWPQFLFTLVNLGFAIYLTLVTVLLTKSVDPLTFLWTLIYLSISLAISHLYMLYMTNKIDDWYDVKAMGSIRNLSIISMLLTTAALAIYAGLEYYHKKQLVGANEESLKRIMPLVAALICSIVLFSSSLKFKKYIQLCRSVDLPAQTLKRNYQTTDN